MIICYLNSLVDFLPFAVFLSFVVAGVYSVYLYLREVKK